MTQSINQSINYEAVSRTAPATPGLLNRAHKLYKKVLAKAKATAMLCTTVIKDTKKQG